MIVPPPPTHMSILAAGVKVIDELKKAKRGLTVSDIQKKTEIVVNDNLIKYLQSNPHLEYNEKTHRYIYKFKYNISCKEELQELLKNGPILISEELENSYDTILEDIQALKDNHEVLWTMHATKKKEVIYLMPYKHPSDLPWEMPAEIKELWNKVSSQYIDNVDLRKYLEKKNVNIAQLDTNVVPEEFNRGGKDKDKKASKRKRRGSGKSNISSDLAQLAQLISQGIRLPGDNSAPSSSANINNEDDQKKQSLLFHNIDANPEEFEQVSDLIRIVGHWFYEDEHVVVLNEFLKQKYHTDSDLVKLLLPAKQVGSILVKLHSHLLISKRICDQGNRQIHVYDMDLDKFVNACNYKLEKMQEVLLEEINELGSSIFQCTACKKRYKALDLSLLYDSGSTHHCINSYCAAPLTNIDNSEKKEKEALLDKLKQQILPLQSLLDKLTHAKSKPTGKAAIRRPIRRAQTSTNRRSTGRTSKVESSLDATLLLENRVKDYDIKLEPQIDFDITPVYCARDKHELYLGIAHTLDQLNDNIALRLAKHFLDEISEFMHIINARVYVYEVTDHSLYLAWARGYSAEEILRLLNTLCRNPISPSLDRLIRDNVNANKFYKATMTLRNRDYCVQSDDRKVLENLIQKSTIRELVPRATQLQEVTTIVNGIKKVSYHFPISSGESEKMKRACRSYGVALIDEFDFGNSANLPSININMKPSTKVRFYQEFAVSRLFWNGFKCHSGILVLPCGAGKTLIGINVVAALKKPCIIFCQSILAVTQWRDQLLRWTTMTESGVSRFSSSHMMEWNPGAEILISTYGMFSAQKNRSAEATTMMTRIKEREWGLMVLDEVHLVPAKIFRKVTNQIRSHIKLGLTATMVREDDLIQDLPCLVGPKLFELDIFTLRMNNFIAPVDCIELHCPMTDIFGRAYAAAKSSEEERLLYSTNPNKTRVVFSLMQYHLSQKHRIMVFCDNLFCLDFYAEILKRPKITGSTHQDDRVRILRYFRESEEGDCVLFSQVGDQSIDLPEAHVVIQVALMHGGRMQEGQRIGRIQRPQEKKDKGYFYSLVSDNTKETEYAKKRRHFLQDHGYVINRLKDNAYEQHLTNETLHVISEDMQKGIIQGIQQELIKREEERTTGKQERVKTTRKRTNDSEKSMKRNLKKLKSKQT